MKNVLWNQIKSILDNLSVAIKKVDRIADPNVGNNKMFVTGKDGKAEWVERTHYIAGATNVPVFVDTTVEGYGNNTYESVGTLALNVGDKYIVVFEGQTYECEAYSFYGYAEAVYIGNGKIIGGEDEEYGPLPGKGEPFAFAQEKLYPDLYLLMDEPVGTRTFSIYHIEEQVKKIEQKYLPEPTITNLKDGLAKGSVNSIGCISDNYPIGEYSVALGSYSYATGENSLAAASGRASGHLSIALGTSAQANGDQSFAAIGGKANGQSSFATNFASANGEYSFAEGSGTASAQYAHAEGQDTNAQGRASHAEGISERDYVKITGEANATVYKVNSGNTTSLRKYQILEYTYYENYQQKVVQATILECDTLESIVLSNTLSADKALSNTRVTILAGFAKGRGSHVEGSDCIAIGGESHAEGYSSVAQGERSHAEGYGTIATGDQHVQGRFNIEDTELEYIHIVGNGGNNFNRANIHTIDRNGNGWFQGDIYVGSTGRVNKDEGSKKVATEDFVATNCLQITDSFVLDCND